MSWSHYREVLSLKDINEIRYYLNECENRNLTVRELQEKIKNKEYERLSNETKAKLINSSELKVEDLVPNPIIIKSDIKEENISEYALKEMILNNIDSFLKELGSGFAYVANEYKIKLESTYNYIDILLFNYKYNAFVVVELKVTELKKEHIGQIMFYMDYIDNNLKSIKEDKTIGLILCKRNNQFVVEFSSDKRIIAREYLVV